MRSIRTRFIALNLVSILLCAAIIGGVSLWLLSTAQRNASDQVMSLVCMQQGSALDRQILGIQSSVDIFAEMAMDSLGAPDVLSDGERLAAYMETAEKMMDSIANNTEGVCSYYLRLAPELTAVQEGFLYALNDDTDQMERVELTDLSLYEPDDDEHVGWYYRPQAAGRPVWLPPYYNRNLNMRMLSYVVPLYLDGVFCGVAGMDIDFGVVIRSVQAIRPYQTGYAFLASSDGAIYYHPALESGTMIADEAPELKDAVKAFSQSAYLRDRAGSYAYRYGGVNKRLSFFRLQNGMELLLTVESREINAPTVTLFRINVLTVVLLSLAAVLLVVPVSNRIIEPLRALTRAADEIARGNMDVKLPAAANDEVGSLTRSFATTVQSLREYIAGMSDIAYLDPLTRVKNKAAFDIAVERLQVEMYERRASFGMVMVDLNNLKQINDRYGHDRGNEYLINGCRMVCTVFKNSPVFRIGGDEFLVLLERSDFLLIDRLMEAFDWHMGLTETYPEPWRRVSAAKGVGMLAPGDKTPDDVFRRADQAMYEDKRRMKAAAKT